MALRSKNEISELTGLEQEPMEMLVTMHCEYINPGTPFEITPPADADLYEDMDSMGGTDYPEDVTAIA